jgi:hypothetical protein
MLSGWIDSGPQKRNASSGDWRHERGEWSDEALPAIVADDFETQGYRFGLDESVIDLKSARLTRKDYFLDVLHSEELMRSAFSNNVAIFRRISRIVADISNRRLA